MLHSRYVGFLKSLDNSTKNHVYFLFNIVKDNVSTMTGRNIRFIMDEYNELTLDDVIINRSKIAKNVVNELLEDEEWKISFLEDLVSQRNFGDPSDGISEEELDIMIENLATS